jgi:hypothetical protein
MKSIACVFILLLAVGCENSTISNARRIANREATAIGSPFRWETQNVKDGSIMYRIMIDLPSGPSRAGDTLRQDILALLQKAEASQARPNFQLEDIKLLPDGREVWVVESATAGTAIAYVITLHPAEQGGTNILVNGPTLFQKTVR